MTANTIGAKTIGIEEPALPLELAPRNCRTKDYLPVDVPAFETNGPFIAYASPESTYAVTRRLMDAARESILVAIYDFTADYVVDILAAAVQRGVKVSIMVDLDRRKGEPETWEALLGLGCEAAPAPSCASQVARYFPSCHEKVIVIDKLWTLVQSGNYSKESIPRNEVDGGIREDFERGNRDMGIAICSPALAEFYTRILRSDMQLQWDAEREAGPEAMQAEAPLEETAVLEAPRPERVAPRLYSSKAYRPRRPVQVVPVLSPDNYMQVVPGLLASARQSIYIEQQYIHPEDHHVQTLLEAMREAKTRNPRLNVRVVLGRPFVRRIEEEKRFLQAMQDYGLRLGTHIRYLNPQYFLHCHNKLVVVDRKSVLVSSQNWSDPAVSKNREAGLLMHSAPLARYYAALFKVDWDTGLLSLDKDEGGEEAPARRQEIVQVSLGDYLEV